jgi:hypothetical protein
LITWDLKSNEEINFYQTDKPCILLPHLVENGEQVRPNMLLTDQFIINLETKKPIQIFCKRMLFIDEQFNYDLRAELISPNGDVLIDPRFRGRLHFFHSLFDLKYLKQLREAKDEEKLEKLLVRVSPFRVFMKGYPILHEFSTDTEFMSIFL